MYKDPHNELLSGSPYSPCAATSDGNLQRTSNREHRWKQGKSQVSILLIVLGPAAGTSAAVPGSSTAPTPDTDLHQQMDTQGLGTSPITPGEPFPFPAQELLSAGTGHCTGQMECGGFRPQNRLFNLPSPPVSFQLEVQALLLKGLRYCWEDVY